ncbi:efflux transporter outer membrane subunit [Methylobacillus caricis]|uniref:efflux transporter outer membrane subunit n=1 Tax=Methylobacillus caricis TaxID=1971611 RepID=UPI001D000BCD|nr:efflux transporter outer membrane subunit [Methylobacillus caricis]MCB5188304.1 efflux transporter outer membrane subunit [Methylobacillus caricis]
MKKTISLPQPRSRHRPAAIAALCLVLAGCQSMAPDYERPAAPVAGHFPQAETAAGTDAASIAWQDYFADEALRSLIREALTNNRDLRSAIQRVEGARALYGVQRADLFPGLNAQGSFARSRTPEDLSLIGRPMVLSEYRAGFGISNWELDFWGRIRSLRDAALETFLAAESSQRASTISLISQVADSYLNLRELDQRILIAEKTIESRQESVRIFQRRFDVGSTSKLDLKQVQALLAQAQTLLYQLQQSRATELNALTVLVGKPIELAPASDAFAKMHMLRELQAGLPSEVLVQRPDIIAAEHILKSANANIGAARAAFFPRVALTASLGTASRELNGLFDAGSHAWNFAPSVSLPIFDGWRNRSNLEFAEVRRDLAVTSYEQTIQTAFREVADALAAQNGIKQQLISQQEMVDAQAERARLAKLRYDHGATSYFEVLDAERSLLDVEQQLVQMQRAYFSSQVRLYAALGGGSQQLASENSAIENRN